MRLEQQIAPHIVKKYPGFYITPEFVTFFTRARRFSQSWATLIQFTRCRHISVRSMLILSFPLLLGVYVPRAPPFSFSFFFLLWHNSPPVGQELLIVEDSWSHSDTPPSVGLLWTSDRPIAEASTRQHTTLTGDWHPCSRRDSNPQS